MREDIKRELYNQNPFRKAFRGTGRILHFVFISSPRSFLRGVRRIYYEIKELKFNRWCEDNGAGLWNGLLYSIAALVVILIFYLLFEFFLFTPYFVGWEISYGTDNNFGAYYQPIRIIRHGIDGYGPKLRDMNEAKWFIRDYREYVDGINTNKKVADHGVRLE